MCMVGSLGSTPVTNTTLKMSYTSKNKNKVQPIF